MWNAIWLFFHKLASPRHFYRISGRLIPWLAWLTGILLVAGLYLGLFVAPPDYQQGQSYRIIFVHVPSAWMSLFIYTFMAVLGAIYLIWNIKLADVMARSSAVLGAAFTFLALATGSLWGKPMWGAWWVWDARLTSELILLFLYLGFIALQASIDDPRRADKAGAILALVGAVNVPIIYFSVKWWNTLHQGASVSLNKAPSMASTMLWGMLLMALCMWMYSIAVALMRVRAIILEREAHTEWAQNVVRE